MPAEVEVTPSKEAQRQNTSKSCTLIDYDISLVPGDTENKRFYTYELIKTVYK